MTDAQAIQRCQNGDRQAFRQLVDRYQDELYGTAILMTGSQAQAAQQVRDALRLAWPGIHGFRTGGPAKPWLMRILIRQGESRHSTSSQAAVPPTNRCQSRDLRSPVEPGQSDRQRQAIRKAFASLDLDSRKLLVLHYFADLTIPQLALALGASNDAVESSLQRALGQFRERLQALGAQEASGQGALCSDQALADALRTHFAETASAVRLPADLWPSIEGRLQDPSRVTGIRRKLLTAAARFWTPVMATGGAVAAASLVVGAATVGCGFGGGESETAAKLVVRDPPAAMAAAAPAPAAPAMPAAVATAAPAAAFETVVKAMPVEGVVVKEVPVETVVEKVVVKEVAVEKLIAAPSAAAAEASAPRREYIPVDLTAGEVDDNKQWTEYLRYRSDYRGPPIHDVDVSERFTITVLDALDRPVPNANVSVSAGDDLVFEGRTYANGQTLFFPRAFPGTSNALTFRLDVEKDGVSQSLSAERNQESEWVVRLDVDQPYGDRVPLDLLFLLDATGSMADEIAQIKTTLLSVSERISALPSRPDLRFGMVTYRDRGDDFVTRLYDFEAHVPTFLSTIQDVVADGGDDTPESLNEALHVAVHRPTWRLDDAIRLVVLVADAPPHLDYAEDFDYAVEMIEANRRGMKIFAIASSGLDEQGEYIFRQLAQHTMGRFAFILYGGETSHSVSGYSVEQLDDLVVRLVQEELDNLKAG